LNFVQKQLIRRFLQRIAAAERQNATVAHIGINHVNQNAGRLKLATLCHLNHMIAEGRFQQIFYQQNI
jgi:hypothetical protein